MYTYFATVTRIVDADTFDITIDKGFRDTLAARLRLYGVNAPEGTATEATVYVRTWLGPLPASVVVRTVKVPPQKFPAPYDNFGRYLAEVFNFSGRSLAADLIAEGYAVPYLP
jgi:endonuclease YncB( thermonuclease family)